MTAGSATALKARPSVVAQTCAKQSSILAAVITVPLVSGLLEGRWYLALSLAPQAVVFAGLAIKVRRWSFPDDLRHIEALCALALLFVAGAASVIPAFIVLGLAPLDAAFEAVSGITSTGLTVATGTESWPVTGHLLRGWIQWCGGFAIAFAGLALLSGTPHSALSMGASSFASRDHLTSLKTQARRVLICYGVLTVLSIVLCLLVLPTWWEAVAIALAAVSTGGFTPRVDSLASYNPVAQTVVMAICLLAAISLMAYVLALRDGFKEAARKSNGLKALGLMLSASVIYVLLALLLPVSDTPSFYGTWLNFISGISTAGFSVQPITQVPGLILFLVIAMVVGADVGSTGGGLKITRVQLLCRTIALSIARTRQPPSALTYLRDESEIVGFDQLISVVTLLCLYLAFLALFWTIFAMSGVAPMSALIEVSSALSTVGLSSGVTGADMPAHLKLTLMAAMLLGRLEFIAVILIFLPRTWHNGGSQ